MTENYLFQLSSLDLHWLAGALSSARLPLMDDPLRHTPSTKLAADSKQASASLEARGWIRRVPGGWQVDRLPAAVINWLGSAAGMLVLELFTRAGVSCRSQVFAQDEACMYVSLEGEQYQFVLLPGRQALSEHLLHEFGAHFAESESLSAGYALPQPLTIVRAAWADQQLAMNMFKMTGLEPTAANPLLAWAKSLDWIATLKKVRLDSERSDAQEQVILCGNGRDCWRGSALETSDEPIRLAPTHKDQLRRIIEQLA